MVSVVYLRDNSDQRTMKQINTRTYISKQGVDSKGTLYWVDTTNRVGIKILQKQIRLHHPECFFQTDYTPLG